jgi:hypothetical protein
VNDLIPVRERTEFIGGRWPSAWSTSYVASLDGVIYHFILEWSEQPSEQALAVAREQVRAKFATRLQFNRRSRAALKGWENKFHEVYLFKVAGLDRLKELVKLRRSKAAKLGWARRRSAKRK